MSEYLPDVKQQITNDEKTPVSTRCVLTACIEYSISMHGFDDASLCTRLPARRPPTPCCRWCTRSSPAPPAHAPLPCPTALRSQGRRRLRLRHPIGGRRRNRWRARSFPCLLPFPPAAWCHLDACWRVSDRSWTGGRLWATQPRAGQLLLGATTLNLLFSLALFTRYLVLLGALGSGVCLGFRSALGRLGIALLDLGSRACFFLCCLGGEPRCFVFSLCNP